MPLDTQRVRALCFDVDGTLSDTDDLWIHRFENFLRLLRFVFPQRKAQPLARWLVMGLETPGNVAYSALDRMHMDDDLARLYNYISKRGIGRKPSNFWLVQGVQDMLQQVAQRYPLAIVSARDEYGTRSFLDQFGLGDLFPVIATSQTCSYTKPFPDPVLWAAERLGVPPQECVMVGDTTVDIRAGKAAGAQTVGVLCGFGRRNELERAGADLIIDNTADLKEIL